MANKASFNANQWELLSKSPYYVQAAINKAEGRMGLMEVRREAKALQSYVDGYKGNSGLAKAVIADMGNGPNLKDKSAEQIADMLGDIAQAVDSKTENDEYDDFMAFLMGAGDAIADATSEGGLLKRGENISDEEEEALTLISHALKASESDKLDRAKSEAAERRQALMKQRQAQAKVAADKKKAAEAKKALEEAEKKLKEAEAREAKRKEAADRQAAANERRRKRLAEKQSAERQAAAAQRREARATAKAEAEAAAATYTVQAGDSLWKIAQEMLGNGNRYMEIAKLNNIKNPSVIFPGTELEMPDK